MRRVMGVVTIVFWASAAVWAVLVALSWVAPALLEERFFLNLSGASLGLAMVSSAFLFWQELRAGRQESRAIPVEEGGEWTPKSVALRDRLRSIILRIVVPVASPVLLLSKPRVFEGASIGSRARHTRHHAPECVEGVCSEVLRLVLPLRRRWMQRLQDAPGCG
jgi:hypothetical protein